MACEMPTHETGDLLVAFVNKDTASNFTTPAGWTALQTQVSAGAGGGVYAKRATSAAETVAFPLASETCCAVVIAVRNVNGTTVTDAVSASAKSGADDSTLPYAGSGVTPLHDNCLILHGLSTDGGIAASALPPWINLFAGDTGANSLCVSYAQQKAAAAVTAPNHWAGALDDTRGFIVAIRDDGTGAEFDAYLPLSTAPAQLITPLSGSTVAAVEKGAYIAAASIAITSVAGKTVTGVAVGVTADSGYNPFRGSTRNAGVSSTTNLNHTEFDLSAAFDASALDGLVFGTFLNSAPRDYVDTGSPSQGGKYILMGSSSANWRAWVVGGQFSKTEIADARNNFLIEVATSDTQYASAGSPNFAAVDYMAFGSSGYYGAPSVLWNELWLIGAVTVAGGGVTPFGFEDIIFAVNNGCGLLPLMQKAGAGATVWAPLKFGGGEKTRALCNLNTFQYPRKADETDYVNFHVSSGKIGIEFDGRDRGAGDVDRLEFTNCLFTSPSTFYWRFAATHAAGAEADFSGSSVVNANVTLRSTVALDGMTFIGCPSFTQNAATLSGSTFNDTKVTSDNPGLISASDFIGAGGHAIEITTPGTYALADIGLSGFGGTPGSNGVSSSGPTDAAIYNNSGGAVTLNISGGDTPSVRNGAGATTVVNATVTLTVSAQVPLAGAEVRVYDLDGAGTSLGTELAGVESNAGATFAFSVTPGNEVWLQVMLAGYEEFGGRITAPATSQTVSIALKTEVNA
jgi:hypothetical protein